MLNEDELTRYHSHLMLDWFSYITQTRLKRAKVLCVGAGGLGSLLLLYLAAAGIGEIGIADPDTISLSNLTRQILYQTSQLQQSKVQAAKERLEQLNPLINVKTYPEKIDNSNVERLIMSHDVIVDCSDNFETKLLLNDVCASKKKLLVMASALQHKGHFAVFDGYHVCYRCIFEQLNITHTSCHENGIISPLLGILSSLQALEVLKFYAGKDNIRDCLIEYDAMALEQKHFKLSANPKCRFSHPSRPAASIHINYKRLASLESLGDKNYLLIDVRSEREHQHDNRGGVCIPLSSLKAKLETFSRAQMIVLYCSSGKRSLVGCEMLVDEGFTNVFWL